MSVLLVGNMAAGKSTIAATLMESGFRKLSFAQGVRDVAAMAYGVPQKNETYLVNDIHSGYIEISGRELMQRVGQDIKLIDQDFWLRIVERKAEHDTGPFVIDDGRFDFELAWARKRNWLIVGVNTAEPIRWQRYETLYGRKPTDSEKNHISEQQVPQLLLECDLVVQGNEDPYVNAKRILDAHEARPNG